MTVTDTTPPREKDTPPHAQPHAPPYAQDEALQDRVDVWVFDLDNTLYPAECALFDQVDRNIGTYVADLLGKTPAEARAVQKDYLVRYGTTLNGLMTNHDVDPHDYLSAVHDIDFSPIPRDDRLRDALQRLDAPKIIFTNADRPYAEKVLDRLGIADQFDGIFDILDADLRPKPHSETYERFVTRHGVNPQKAVMVEDMACNLKPAHAMGMQTVWINTGSPWGRKGHDPDIIHTEITSLSAWLDTVVK